MYGTGPERGEGEKEKIKIGKKSDMKVLVDCERSQVVCKAFRELGHEAYSCDKEPSYGDLPEYHIQDDAIKVLYSQKWDLVIAHPPCTRLANSGVRWLHERNLWEDLIQARLFFMRFVDYGLKGNKIGIENPIPHKYAELPPYTQIIQPWQFGHPESKATCLWLYNLPKLQPTNIVKAEKQSCWRMPPSKDRATLRSKTFAGIGKAFAEQWGVLEKTPVSQKYV